MTDILENLTQRTIIITTKLIRNVKIYYDITTFANNTGNGFYVPEITFFRSSNETFLKNDVSEIYIELLPGEHPASHHSFCKSLAHTFDVRVRFTFDGLDFVVEKNTPDDWWELCIEDAMVYHTERPNELKSVGPNYIEIPTDLLKKNLWLCSMRVTELEDVIDRGIEYDYPEKNMGWRTEFGSYLEYRKWNIERFTEIFIFKRRVKRYVDILKMRNESLEDEDIAKYQEEFKNATQYISPAIRKKFE